jgi:hypothetical protein
MQVKSGRQCNLANSGTSASFPFKKQDLEYWRRQPVPVFCALVPASWPISESPDIFIVDITKQLLSLKQINKKQKRLKSDFHLPANCRDSVKDFVTLSVPTSTAMHSLNKGIVTSIPQLNQEYVVKTPIVPVENFMGDIIRRIRVTAAQSARSLFSRNAVTQISEDHRKTLKALVQCFEKDKHWENCFSLALFEHWEKDFPEAVRHYKASSDIIKGDPEISIEDGDDWDKIIKRIETLQHDAKNQIPLDMDSKCCGNSRQTRPC